MQKPIIHPAWHLPQDNFVHGFSLEITAKDVDALREAAPLIPAETPVAVTFLPGETLEARIQACRAVRSLGFEPMPHFSARRIASQDEFETYLRTAVKTAGVRRCFVIAGDPSEAEGPFTDSMSLIRSGAFERADIKVIGIAGHPEGHPAMSEEDCMRVLASKCEEINRRGMAALIVTQFGFDAQATLAWLAAVRRHGLDAPVRLGVPGPAGIKRLLSYAARCGVGASASVLAKYGISLGRLMGLAGPDRYLDTLAKGLGEEHGMVRLHFYPFGGVAKTAEWIADYARKH